MRNQDIPIFRPGMPSEIIISSLRLVRNPFVQIQGPNIVYSWTSEHGRATVFVIDKYIPELGRPERQVIVYGTDTSPPPAAGKIMAEIFMPDSITVGAYIELWTDSPQAILIAEMAGTLSAVATES